MEKLSRIYVGLRNFTGAIMDADVIYLTGGNPLGIEMKSPGERIRDYLGKGYDIITEQEAEEYTERICRR